MLHHISIAANHPRQVAEILAEIFQGQVAPFPFNPGSYVALAGDEFGTLIEIYPRGSELVPDGREGEAGFQLNQQPSHYAPFHVAISVPSSLAEIKQIGDRVGWRVFPTNRDGLFDVIEFWVENRLMIELLTPPMVPKYLQTLAPETLPALIEQMSLADA